jgi:hypothetical protein
VEYGAATITMHTAFNSIFPKAAGSGLGVAAGTAKRLGAELEWLEPQLQRLNPDGFRSLKTLCVHERSIDPQAEPAAVVVLCELAQLLRKTGRR